MSRPLAGLMCPAYRSSREFGSGLTVAASNRLHRSPCVLHVYQIRSLFPSPSNLSTGRPFPAQSPLSCRLCKILALFRSPASASFRYCRSRIHTHTLVGTQECPAARHFSSNHRKAIAMFDGVHSGAERGRDPSLPFAFGPRNFHWGTRCDCALVTIAFASSSVKFPMEWTVVILLSGSAVIVRFESNRPVHGCSRMPLRAPSLHPHTASGRGNLQLPDNPAWEYIPWDSLARVATCMRGARHRPWASACLHIPVRVHRASVFQVLTGGESMRKCNCALRAARIALYGSIPFNCASYSSLVMSPCRERAYGKMKPCNPWPWKDLITSHLRRVPPAQRKLFCHLH